MYSELISPPLGPTQSGHNQEVVIIVGPSYIEHICLGAKSGGLRTQAGLDIEWT